MIVPVILTTLFTVPHWWKREDTVQKRLITFPFLLVQFWPQLQYLKVLKMVIQGDNQWRVEKEKLQKEIGSLGKQIQVLYHQIFFNFLISGIPNTININGYLVRFLLRP